jgi:hypothetical protein
MRGVDRTIILPVWLGVGEYYYLLKKIAKSFYIPKTVSSGAVSAAVNLR